MATKTFEELKQLAIQIRDEKTNKQNTATRIGTQMLEHLDKLEQDYYDKTATDEELKERDEKLTELESIICNNIFDSETGKLVELKGRFQINRLFDIDSEPSVSFTPLLTIFKRYYNINGQFIGTNYTNDAKFIAIGGIINDDQTTINKNEVAKYMLSFNGVNYQCIDGLPLVNNDVKK